MSAHEIVDLLMKRGQLPEEQAVSLSAALEKIPPEELTRVLRNGNGAHLDAEPELARGDAYPTLRDLVENPDLLKPPEMVLPRIAARGRTVLLAGPEKTGGKSTLAGHGAAALSRGGWFLGEKVEVGSVVVVAPDEALGDTVRRLHDRAADLDRVRVLALHPPQPARLAGRSPCCRTGGPRCRRLARRVGAPRDGAGTR